MATLLKTTVIDNPSIQEGNGSQINVIDNLEEMPDDDDKECDCSDLPDYLNCESEEDVYIKVAICGLCAALCCMVGIIGLFPVLKWKSRIIYIWVWVIIFPVTIVMVLNFHFYKPVTSKVPFPQSDYITERFDSYLCGWLTLKSDPVVDLYLLNATLSLEKKTSQFMFEDRIQEIKYDKEISKEFFLSEGTILEVHARRASSTQSYSDTPFVQLKKGKDRKLIRSVEIREDDKLLLYYIIPETDDYYIVFSCRTASIKSCIPVDITSFIEVALYDIPRNSSYIISSKTEVTKATFGLEYGKTYGFVAVYSDKVLQTNPYVTSKCEPRLEIYLTLFFAVPLVTGIAISSIIYAKCRHKKSDSLQDITTDIESTAKNNDPEENTSANL